MLFAACVGLLAFVGGLTLLACAWSLLISLSPLLHLFVAHSRARCHALLPYVTTTRDSWAGRLKQELGHELTEGTQTRDEHQPTNAGTLPGTLREL